MVSLPSPAYFWNSLLTHIIHFLSSLKKFYIIPITINNLNNIIAKNNHLVTNYRPINSIPTPNHVPFEIIEGIRVMALNTTFNNISVISWRSVLLVDETWVPRENHRPAAIHWQTLSHNVVSSTPRLSWAGFEHVTLVAICTDCTDSCKLKT